MPSSNGKLEFAVTQMDSLDNVVVDCDHATVIDSPQSSMEKFHPIRSNTVNDMESLEDIDAAYFIEDEFDSIDHVLKKMANVGLSPNDLRMEVRKTKQQLQVVSKCISTMIMEKSPSYSTQMAEIENIFVDLDGVISGIQNIRRKLLCAKRDSFNGLQILSNVRNRNFSKNLLLSLKGIKTLYEVQFQLKDLTQEENYPAAVALGQQALEAAANFSEYHCIVDLLKSLSRSIEEIETSLDKSLSSLTVVFEIDRYSMVHTAYKMLGKAEESANKITSFTQAALEESGRTVIADRIISKNDMSCVSDLSFEEMCGKIVPEQLGECIRELTFVFVKVLSNYHSILRFHVDECDRLECVQEDSGDAGIVKKILISSMYSVFKTASTKLNTMLCFHDLSTMEFDGFVKVIELSTRFRKFGRTYFGNSSAEIALSLEKQSCIHFKRYHRERMDELRMFLENEAFAPCPLPAQFIIFDLQEFSFLKDNIDNRKMCSDLSTVECESELGEQLDFQLMQPEAVLTFASETTESSQQNGSIFDFEFHNSIDQENSSIPNSDLHAPIICNTALNLLRFIGKNIRMAYILDSIAQLAVDDIFQLFNFFARTIHHLFTSEIHCEAEFCSSNLQAFLNEIDIDLSPSDSDAFEDIRLGACCLINGRDPNSCNWTDMLRECIVGVESLKFVCKQLHLIRPVIESISQLDEVKSAVDKFYSKICYVTPDIENCIYGCLANKIINYRQFYLDIGATNWEIYELKSQHSAYVETLLKELSFFKLLLNDVESSINLCESVRPALWAAVMKQSFTILVQGYSEFGKKCTNEGRALMQLDFQHLLGMSQRITGCKSTPYKEYVDSYIKAYYLPESSLEQWIHQHTEYTANQIIALLDVATHVSKKARSRIISALDT